MKTRLLLLSFLAVLALVGISAWATTCVPIRLALHDLAAQPSSGNNPWFVATLFDTAFAFLWFWLWVAYKETSLLARSAWLLLIFGLGNIAMGAYLILQLKRLPADARIEDLLLRRP